jgi:arsenate reductase
MDRPYNLLFVSGSNAGRSVMSEGVVNRNGNGKFRAFSAAIEPSDAVDPVAIEV